MLRPFCSSIRLLASLVLPFLSTASLHAAELTVAPNSHYFKDWAFTSFPPSVSPLQTEFKAPNSEVHGTLSNLDVTVKFGQQVTSAGIFPNGRFAFGQSLPVGIDEPALPGSPFMAKGLMNIVTDKPLPYGTLFSFSDFDNGESAKFRFFDCAGAVVDSSGFDILWISTMQANRPIVTSGSDASGSYWSVRAPVPYLTNLDFPVDGLLIRSSAVCRIQIEGDRPQTPAVPTNTTDNYGSANYALGAPRSAFQVAAAPVPALDVLSLGVLSMVLGGLGMRVARRRKS